MVGRHETFIGHIPEYGTNDVRNHVPSLGDGTIVELVTAPVKTRYITDLRVPPALRTWNSPWTPGIVAVANSFGNGSESRVVRISCLEANIKNSCRFNR